MTSWIFLLGAAVDDRTTTAEQAWEFRGTRVYENMIEVQTCTELLVSGTPIAWVTRSTQTNIGLITQKCETLDQPDSVSPEAVSGYASIDWYQLRPDQKKLVPLKLPKHGYFSNVAFCGDFAAYWGFQKGTEASLIIANLRTRKIIREHHIGKLVLETDDRWFLNSAIWDKSCTQATFDDARYIKPKVMLVKSL